jgi:predicted phosphohydrolase
MTSQPAIQSTPPAQAPAGSTSEEMTSQPAIQSTPPAQAPAIQSTPPAQAPAGSTDHNSTIVVSNSSLPTPHESLQYKIESDTKKGWTRGNELIKNLKDSQIGLRSATPVNPHMRRYQHDSDCVANSVFEVLKSEYNEDIHVSKSKADFEKITKTPGAVRKLLNKVHDYWWGSQPQDMKNWKWYENVTALETLGLLMCTTKTSHRGSELTKASQFYMHMMHRRNESFFRKITQYLQTWFVECRLLKRIDVELCMSIYGWVPDEDHEEFERLTSHKKV